MPDDTINKIKDFFPPPRDKKRLQVRVDVQILEAVQAQASADQVTMTELVEAMCLHYLRESGKPFKRK
jgi:hypothetical protein